MTLLSESERHKIAAKFHEERRDDNNILLERKMENALSEDRRRGEQCKVARADKVAIGFYFTRHCHGLVANISTSLEGAFTVVIVLSQFPRCLVVLFNFCDFLPA